MKSSETLMPEIIVRARSFSHSYAAEADDPWFETKHIDNVVKNILRLAEERNMDSRRAELTALLHDIGRTKGGVIGKGHAEKGAEQAYDFLISSGVDIKVSKKISKAIANHNKKKKIHGKYSELIKDADSMTRFPEGYPGDENDREYLRSKYAYIGKCSILYNGNLDIYEVLLLKFLEIRGLLSDMISQGVTSAAVHEIRIEIRSVRSLLWYLRKSVSCETGGIINIVDQELKEVFRDYGYPRKIQVLRKKIKKLGKFNKITKCLGKLRKRALLRLEDAITETHFDSIDDVLERVKIIQEELGSLDSSALSKRINVKKILNKTDVSDIASLHRFRIFCKKIYYLNEMGIIELTYPESIEHIKKLNRLIGRMNDNIENKKILKELHKENPKIFKTSDYTAMMKYFTPGDEQIKAIDDELFKLHLIF